MNCNEPDGKEITFLRVLLNNCQEAFEGADKLRSELKQMNAPEKGYESSDKERMIKIHTLGNIKLISEILKRKMVPGKIVHHIVQLGCINEYFQFTNSLRREDHRSELLLDGLAGLSTKHGHLCFYGNCVVCKADDSYATALRSSDASKGFYGAQCVGFYGKICAWKFVALMLEGMGSSADVDTVSKDGFISTNLVYSEAQIRHASRHDQGVSRHELMLLRNSRPISSFFMS
ncbi:unnamed protein product [Lactuca saligna]|uniref:MIF4G domain-containing protein n=1 Tax=Lactuca saligna TaxID=75948 RepID=A0AA35XY47_LACSI|nr:unnamed protein product [Lactuca saligna]